MFEDDSEVHRDAASEVLDKPIASMADETGVSSVPSLPGKLTKDVVKDVHAGLEILGLFTPP